ncbi:MAG TPA: zinc ribbon domain-containing protein [Candidatus Tectomicrobia bacterium]
MPIYEFRCEVCEHTFSLYFRTATAPPPDQCRYCGSSNLQRLFSSFAYLMTEQTRASKLDPKYHKQVDAALSKAPADSDPNYYLRKMVPFSRAKEAGEPYFKKES